MPCSCACGHIGTCICCADACKPLLEQPSAEDKAGDLLKSILKNPQRKEQ
jgi:hypothetical protein